MRKKSGVRLIAPLVALVMILTMVAGWVISPHQEAKADYADSNIGQGRFKNSIYWLEWDAFAKDARVQNGATATGEREIVPGKTVKVSCQISNIASVPGNAEEGLFYYIPGTWRGDGLDNLYADKGVNDANRMRIGLRTGQGPQPDNPKPGDRMGAGAQFDVNCTATLNGHPFNLQGMVFADAEANGRGEYLKVDPIGSEKITWRVIDGISECNLHSANELNGSSLKIYANQDECAVRDKNTSAGPMAVYLADNLQKAHVTLRGAGTSAVALGVVIGADYSDAPGTYGNAAASRQFDWNGGTVRTTQWDGGLVPQGISDPFRKINGKYDWGKPVLTAPYLGKTVDNDRQVLDSFNASLDDITDGGPGVVAPANDEDGIPSANGRYTGYISARPGKTETITMTCAGPGKVRGWIDWNIDGKFDGPTTNNPASEQDRSELVDCVGGKAEIKFKAPENSGLLEGEPGTNVGKTTFGRFRIASDIPVGHPAYANSGMEIHNPRGFTFDGEVEDYVLPIASRKLDITKTGSETLVTKNGTVVKYTIKVTNNSQTNFTNEDPAVIYDDLAGVADDGDYNRDFRGDKPGGEFFVGGKLSWQGPLKVGETATFTYSVTSKKDGDGRAKNIAWQPRADRNIPQGSNQPTPKCELNPGSKIDKTTGEVCATHEWVKAQLELGKTATGENGQTVTDLPATGAKINYVVTVKNTGPGAYSAEKPATASDDLTKVLDDATLDEASIKASAGTATLSPDKKKINWSGPLAANTNATITYSVTYNGKGDEQLHNTVCAPGTGEKEVCANHTIPSSKVKVTKTADPAHGTVIKAGQAVKYTLTFDNKEGTGSASVDYTDHLIGVLDDADISDLKVDQANAGINVTEIDRATKSFKVNGRVPAGQSYTVSYTAKVKADGARGNNQLVNVLRPTKPVDPNKPPAPVAEDTVCDPAKEICTSHPVAELKVTKAANPASGTEVKAGEAIKYTLTFDNAKGKAPAAVDYTDQLIGVLDDAEVTDIKVDQAGAGINASALDTSSNSFTVKGNVPAGTTYTVSYTAKVKADGARGNNQLVNVLRPTKPVDPNNPPAPVTGDSVCDPAKEICTTHPVANLKVTKVADPATGTALKPGQDVKFTLTFDNKAGKAAAVVDHTDHLIGVLDDATVSGIKVDQENAGIKTSNLDENTKSFKVTGQVPAGASYTVSYTAKVKADGARGNNQLVNVLRPTKPVDPNKPPAPVTADTTCDPAKEICTTHPVANLKVAKAADPATGTQVKAGQTVKYTLTFDNTTGKALAPVDHTDHLVGVFDDAEVSGLKVDQDGAQIAVSDIDEKSKSFTVKGNVPAGEKYTVSYTAKVKADGARGNNQLVNVLRPTKPVDPNNPPAPVTGDSVCDPAKEICTSHPVAELKVAKAANPATGTALKPGQDVKYTLTFDNKAGKADAAVDYTDHLVGVFDDAEVSGLKVDQEGAQIAVSDIDTKAKSFTVKGNVPAGASYTVSYTAKVKADGARGNNQLVNVLRPTVPVDPENPPAPVTEDTTCDPKVEVCTSHPVANLKVSKVADTPSGANVRPGEAVKFTLTFDNSTGKAPAAVDHTDYLVGLVDDADVSAVKVDQEGASIKASDIDAASKSFKITGTVPTGVTYTVSYTAKVKADGARGNNQLVNVLRPTKPVDPNNPPAPVTAETVCDPAVEMCTSHPVADLKVAKTSDPASGTALKAGQTVKYALTFDNTTGKAAAEVDHTDYLVGVFDDAQVTDLKVDQTGAKVTVSGIDTKTKSFTVKGNVPAGEKYTVSYTATVKADAERGNNALVNILRPNKPANPGDPDNPGGDPGDPGNPGGNPPAPVTGDSVCDPKVDICTSHPVPNLKVAKSSDPASTTAVKPGQDVKFTLTFDNTTGKAPAAVDHTDHLIGVLDDAQARGLRVDQEGAQIAVSGIDEKSKSFTVKGNVPAGKKYTVTYMAKVKADGARGNSVLVNVLRPTKPVDPENPPAPVTEDTTCDPKVEMCTSHPVSDLVVAKSVDPASGQNVKTGQDLTYTLSFASKGTAPVTVDHEDALAGLLDDGKLVGDPVVDGPLKVTRDGDKFIIKGKLEGGTKATVTYRLKVNEGKSKGDGVLKNFLIPAGADIPETCVPREGEPVTCTVNYVSAISIIKSSNPPSATKVSDGRVIRYAVTVKNLAKSDKAHPENIKVVDYLGDVFDDADLISGPVSNLDGIKAAIKGDKLSISGPLPAGKEVVVTYLVKVKKYADQKNHVIGNVVANGDNPPVCVPGSQLCTKHITEKPKGVLAKTGVTSTTALLLGVLALLGAAGVMTVGRKRLS